MKVSREVKTYRIRLFCDECGKEMEYDGITLASNPPQYPHRCQDKFCRQPQLNMEDIYPKLIYREVINENDRQ